MYVFDYGAFMYYTKFCPQTDLSKLTCYSISFINKTHNGLIQAHTTLHTSHASL